MSEQAQDQTEPQVTPSPMEALKADLRRAAHIKAILEANKPLYDELDAIAVRASKAMGSLKVVEADGMVFRLVDNFEERNTVFRPCGVKRFELSIETQAQHHERLTKAIKKAQRAAKIPGDES